MATAAVPMKSVVIDPSLYDWEGDEPLRREFLDFLARHGRGAGEGRGPA